jgi:hypothetical protein
MGNTFQHMSGGDAGANEANRSVPTEIMVEGVGPMRMLNDWQLVRLARIRGPNRAIAPLAMGLGLTYQQFRQLSPVQQKAAREAFAALLAPPAPRQQGRRQSWLPSPWERISEERQALIGRKLLQVKAELPHGHFGPWIDEQSGITRSQAARFMKAAKHVETKGGESVAQPLRAHEVAA